MKGLSDRQKDIQKDKVWFDSRQMSGWKDSCMDGCTDRQTDI